MNRRMAKMLATALFAAALTRGDEEDVVYRVDRTFDPTDTTIGDATVFNIVNSANTNLTGIIIGKYSITTNDQSATEREGVSWGQTSTTQAWQNVTNALTIGSYSNIFDDPGWIKGVKTVTLNGKTTYGAYMWWLQNTLEFTTPGSTYWTNAGCTYLLENVLVGTLGDYLPGTNYTETFPKMDDPGATNWPGCPFLTSAMPASNQTVKYSFDTTAYYELLSVEIRGEDGGPAPKCVPYNDDWQRLRCVVTPDKPGVCYWEMLPGSTNAEVQWEWAQQPITAFSTSGHSATRDDQVIQLKYSPNDSSTTATVQHAFTIVDVQYSKYAGGQVYGFDHTTTTPWKSVEVGQTDKVTGRIYPWNAPCTNIYICSTQPGDVSVSSGNPGYHSQTLTIGGSNITKTAEIEARLESTNGVSAGDLKVWSQELFKRTLKIIAVDESTTNLPADETCISIPLLREMLNSNVYNQAVVKWTVADDVTVTNAHWDLNGDGKIEVDPYTNSEMSVILNSCTDTNFDMNVFLVKTSVSNSVVGWAEIQEPASHPETAFIFTDAANQVTAAKRAQAIAHEIGHAMFSLHHITNDTSNLMWRHINQAGTHLRRVQWQKINEIP